MTIGPDTTMRLVRLLVLRDAFLQGVPRQHRALDAHGILHDALERDEVAELVLARSFLPRHHLAEVDNQAFDLIDLLSADLLGQHGRRCLRYRAALSLER